MGWFYPKRRGGGAEMKQQGFTGQTMKTFSPTLHLVIIFGIVVSLLWFSHYTDYKAQSHKTAIKFQLFLLVSPILLILFLISYSSSGRLNFHFTNSKHNSLRQVRLMKAGQPDRLLQPKKLSSYTLPCGFK